MARGGGVVGLLNIFFKADGMVLDALARRRAIFWIFSKNAA